LHFELLSEREYKDTCQTAFRTVSVSIVVVPTGRGSNFLVGDLLARSVVSFVSTCVLRGQWVTTNTEDARSSQSAVPAGRSSNFLVEDLWAINVVSFVSTLCLW